MKGRVTSVEAMPVKLDFGGEKSLPLLCRGKTDCYAVCGDHRKVVEGIVTRRKAIESLVRIPSVTAKP